MPDEFWAAIVGAVVGGVITTLLQVAQQTHERSLRNSERLEQRKMFAYSLVYKLMTINSMFVRVSHHLEKAFEAAPEDWEPWQFLEGYATSHKHVVFSPEEMTLLLKVSADSFNDIAALDEVHNALSDTLGVFSRHKERIHELLPPSRMDGRKGHIEATQEQYMAARPYMVVANGIARDMRLSAKRDASRTFQAMQAAIPKFNRTLDMKLLVEQKAPEEWLDLPQV